jgi:hypothetical protein
MREEDKGHALDISVCSMMARGGRSGEYVLTYGIPCTERAWKIKAIKRKINSLNGFLTKFGVTFVLNSSRLIVLIDIKKERKM